MSVREIRKNPFTGEVVIFSEIRQDRPDRDSSKCPLCSGSEEVPTFTKPLRISNKFPALSKDVEYKKYKKDSFYEKTSGYGCCELVVYTDMHNSKFIELLVDESMGILEAWMQATKQLGSNKNLKYILPFENYGEEVGATLLHPHGQIYAFPFIPDYMKREMKTILEYRKNHNKCMMCDYLATEQEGKDRIIYEDENIVVLIPYFAKYSYDLFIYLKRHISFLHQCTRSEMVSMLSFFPIAIKALNKLFEKEVSYSLSLHQGPINSEGSTAFHMYFKLHTPQRNKKSIKLLGAVETSTNTFINGTLPETAAAQLRKLML
ncbi:MAG: galactose-1-phosphate uridylyltransferase [Asgard group archaeon]|nr:galactose-1-phosphate uridylyltransferase [Asgard group archaeon]